MGVLFYSPGVSQQYYRYQKFVPQNYSLKQVVEDSASKYPEPKKVLKQSFLIPGWGQVTNGQSWKVPIVYGVIGGLTYYSVHVHKQYNDYRAAYYNAVHGEDSDFRFGPTPSTIPANTNANSLRQSRNIYRNRRDLVYVLIGVSYVLNAFEAYIYAHLRTFDVSDDLSMNVTMSPGISSAKIMDPAPSLTISFNF